MKPLKPFESYKLACLFKEVCSGFVHEGWDFNLQGTWGNQDCGTPLKAVADGEIVHYSESDKNYGKLVVLKCKTDKGDRWVRYAHCREVFVKSGIIKRGDMVALLGSTGNSTACHLHLDVLKNKKTNWRFYSSNVEKYFENPLDFFNSNLAINMEFTDQTKIPIGGDYGEVELQAVKSLLYDQKRAIENLEDRLQKAEGNRTKLEKEITELNIKLDKKIEDQDATFLLRLGIMKLLGLK